MASTMTTMQSHGGFPYYERSISEPNINFFGPQQGWDSAVYGGKPVTPGYLDYAASNTPPSDNDLYLDPMPSQEDMKIGVAKRPHDMSSIQAPNMYPNSTTMSSLSPLGFVSAGPGMYSSAAVFRIENSKAKNHNSPAVSPLETRFDLPGAPEAFSSPFSFQSSPHSVHGQNIIQATTASQKATGGFHGDSTELKYNDSYPERVPSTGGRRRRSENVAPGSTRAIYLEKNRRAASKCRSKQKMQQEGLVQTARDFKVRNGYLKKQVEMLKDEIHGLMESVSLHNDCEDGRLREYVQRKADRLAAGVQPGPYMPPMAVPTTQSPSPSTPSSINF